MMKNMHFKFGLIGLIVLVLTGCHEWLDEPDMGHHLSQESYTKHMQDLDKLLKGGYNALLGGEDGDGIASAPFLISALQSDNFKPYPPNKNEIPQKLMDLYNRNNQTVEEGGYIYSLLEATATAANNANTVLDEIPELKDDPDYEELKDRIKGEALLLRSMSNFIQTQLYGPQYHQTTLNQEAGLYKQKPVDNLDDLSTDRKTVEEAYQLSIRDAKKAAALLPRSYDAASHPANYNSRRFNKDVAYAQLARMYFQANKWDSCFAYCNKLLDLGTNDAGNKSPKYPLYTSINTLQNQAYNNEESSAYTPDTTTNTESGLIADFYGGSPNNGPTLNEHPVGAYFVKPDKGGKGYFCLTDDFMEEARPFIENPLKDERLKLIDTAIHNGDTNYFMNKSYQPNTNILWFRAAEFHLMRAEYFARKESNTDKAKDELNQIRDFRKATLYPYSAGDEGDILESIIRERRKEFVLENNRIWDLLRIGAIESEQGSKYLNNGQIPDGDRTNGNTNLSWKDPIWNIPFTSTHNE